jgi:hypothetical protein
MNRVLVVFVLLLFLIIASCMPQMPARMATHMAKTGLVIDTETGKPMPNVIVIASGWSSQGGVLVGNGGYSTLYRIVTTTDAEGRYHIPTTWLDMSPWVPGFYPRVGWIVTVFQTGYAVVGDERAWEADSRGMMNHRALSGLVTPSYSYKGSFIEVDPIRMYKPTLTLPLRQTTCRPVRLLLPGAKGTMTWLDTDKRSKTERWLVCCRQRAHHLMRLRRTWELQRSRSIAG